MADSTLGCGPTTIKYLVFLFNLLFFISGLTLIIVGAVVQGFFKEYVRFFQDDFNSPAIGIMLLGTIILFISFFGCCGAKYESVCMLRTFGIFMGLLLLSEIAVSISIAVLRSEIKGVVVVKMNESMNEYGNATLAKSTWDDIQSNLHCCGTNNFTDWQNTPFGNGSSVPDSCCEEQYFQVGCGQDALDDPALSSHVYHKGCLDALDKSAVKNLGAIIGSAVGLAVIQLIGIWMSHCLVKAIKERYEIL